MLWITTCKDCKKCRPKQSIICGHTRGYTIVLMKINYRALKNDCNSMKPRLCYTVYLYNVNYSASLRTKWVFNKLAYISKVFYKH